MRLCVQVTIFFNFVISADLGKLSLKTDIGASTETIGMNGTAANGSEPGSPELKTPTFMVCTADSHDWMKID